MAKKEKTEESADGMLTAAAKSVGKAAGKVAAAVGVGSESSDAPKQPSTKVPKLAKKNKTRLPRREKKARKKAGTA